MIAEEAVKEQHWILEETEKVVVEVWTYWPDRRTRDCHNGSKLMMDALEGIVYKDDKRALVRYMDYEVDKENPRVELKIYLKEAHGDDKVS